MDERSGRTDEFGRGVELVLSLIHGLGLGLSSALFIVLLVDSARAADPWLVMAASLWGAAVIFRYLSSILHHSFSRKAVSRAFRIMDHAGEYYFIPAAIAPLCLGPARGLMGWLVFGVGWAAAVYGILFSSIYFGRLRWFPLLSLVSLAWVASFFLPGVRTESPSFELFFTGWIVYLIGCIFYAEEEKAAKHLLWHAISLCGTVLLGLGAIAAIRGFS